MTIGNPNLGRNGPIVEVYFTVSKELEDQFKQKNEKVPEPIKVKALVDTGATTCVVKEEIPKNLGLSPIGKTPISTAHGNHECYQYFLRMIIPHPTGPLTYEGVFVAANLGGQDLSCLIGRDFLSNGILVYIGYANQFTLSIG